MIQGDNKNISANNIITFFKIYAMPTPLDILLDPVSLGILHAIHHAKGIHQYN